MKLTQEQLKKIVNDCWLDFQIETEHRKGASFYATGSYEIVEEDVEEISTTIGVDLNELKALIGTYICVVGTWSDDDGCDWYEYSQAKKVIITVPEKIIPEHTIVELQPF